MNSKLSSKPISPQSTARPWAGKLVVLTGILVLLSICGGHARADEPLTCEPSAPPVANCDLAVDGSCVYAIVFVRLDNGTQALALGDPCGIYGGSGLNGYKTFEEAEACGHYFVRNGAPAPGVNGYEVYREVPKFLLVGAIASPGGGGDGRRRVTVLKRRH